MLRSAGKGTSMNSVLTPQAQPQMAMQPQMMQGPGGQLMMPMMVQGPDGQPMMMMAPVQAPAGQDGQPMMMAPGAPGGQPMMMAPMQAPPS